MVGAALGVIMAIIMVHHMAIISAQAPNPHVGADAAAPVFMPGIMSGAC